MRAEGRLGEGSLLEAVKMERCADVVAMLALLCEVPMPLVQSLLQEGHREAVLIPCKAAALSWRTVRTILASRTIGLPMSEKWHRRGTGSGGGQSVRLMSTTGRQLHRSRRRNGWHGARLIGTDGAKLLRLPISD